MNLILSKPTPSAANAAVRIEGLGSLQEQMKSALKFRVELWENNTGSGYSAGNSLEVQTTSDHFVGNPGVLGCEKPTQDLAIQTAIL